MQMTTLTPDRLRTTLVLTAALLIAGWLPSARGQAASTTNIITTIVTTTATVTPAGTNTTITTNITTAAVTPPKPPRWETSASAGLTLTRGNSKTLLATVGVDTKRKWDQNELAFGLAAGYGTDNGVENNKFVNGFGQYNRLFSDRWYGGLRLDGSYDGIAQLDYRLSLTPLVGYYAIKEPNASLVFEAGPSGVTEKHEGESADSYIGLRLSERFDYKLSASTKIWESVSYVPRVDKWADQYVLNFEAGIDTAITKHWSLRVVLQDIYDSEPTPGREKNDLRLVAGTAYKF